MKFWLKKYVVAIWQHHFFGDSETSIINEFVFKHQAIKEYEAWCKDESVMICVLYKRYKRYNAGSIKILRRFYR